MKSTRDFVMAIGCVGLLSASTACREAPHSVQTTAERSPRAVVAAFIESRKARDYKSLEPLIVSEQALQVSAFVARVDRFLDANKALCELVRDRVAVGMAESIDQSYLTAALGLFGPESQVLDEQLGEISATVSYSASGRLPAEHVVLRRVGSAWKIDPGSGFSPLLSEGFAALAEGLERLASDLRGGTPPAEALIKDPALLPKKVEAALRRGIELLSKARAHAAEPRP